MSPPEPMLSCSARRWPEGGEWVLQPKWDGFRLLIEVDGDRHVRASSRHGTSLTTRLGDLIAAFAEAPARSVFDGELVVISERGGRPVQDFGAVCRAVLRGDATAAENLRFVAFDVLALSGEDLRRRPWTERNLRLTNALPTSGPLRRVESLPASPAAHAAIVALGFEGTVLKRPNSTYRSGRQRVWLKHKARYSADGVLLSVREGRDGQWHGVCDVDGRRVSVLAGASWVDRVGEVLTLVYSRVDADGDLREVRIAGPANAPSAAASQRELLDSAAHRFNPDSARAGRRTLPALDERGSQAVDLTAHKALVALIGRDLCISPFACFSRGSLNRRGDPTISAPADIQDCRLKGG